MAGGQIISAMPGSSRGYRSALRQGPCWEKPWQRSDSKTEEAVGTANLYFRYATTLQCSYLFAQKACTVCTCLAWPCTMFPVCLLQH